MNILLLGPQGSGKGTQARLLLNKLGSIGSKYYYFESGTFFRELAKKDKKIDETINKKGQLISDEKTVRLISGFLESKLPQRDNLILDGFPRSIRQFELISEWFAKKSKKINLAIHLDIGKNETIKRLSARRVCVNCGEIYNLITAPPLKENICSCGGKLVQREDDKPKAIKVRLDAYLKMTRPLIVRLDSLGILARIDGERPIDTIFADIWKLAEKEAYGTGNN